MGYCNTRWSTWISDYYFTLALAHRLQVESSAAVVQDAEPRRTLLLWGGVHDGHVSLEPAFEHVGRVKLPEAPGPYRLDGLDGRGRKLFSLSFRPDELDHRGSTFLFAIPYKTEWTRALDRVVLSGPEGSATLNRDVGGKAALLVDRSTGRVRSITREWPGVLPGGMAMDADTEVRVIRGLPRS